MPLSITLTPNITTYVQGDAPITVSMGAGSGSNTSVLWESNNGTFADKYAATTTFTPNNASKLTSIIGRRVNRTIAVNSTNILASGGYLAWGKGASGTENTWDTFLWFDNWFDATIPTATGMFQATADDLGEKAIGFNNTGVLNPETVGTATTSMAYTWHLQKTGLATPRHFGTSIATPVPYKVGSVFKLEVTTTAVNYYIDGVWIASAPRINTGFWAVMTFKNNWSWWSMASWLNKQVYPDLEGTAYITVSGLFPLQPNYTYNQSTDVGIITSTAIDGSEKRRRKTKQRKTINLQFTERPYSEYKLLADFWKAHEKHEKFVFQDLVLGESYTMRFDAPLSTNMKGPDTVDIQATLREV